MVELHIPREKQSGTDLSFRLGPGASSHSPELAISQMGRWEEFFSSIRTLLFGPTAPKKFLGDPYFRDCWIDQRTPRAAFAVAVACQVLLILFPPPVWNIRPAQVEAFSPPMELTWYGPPKDFPAILPRLAAPKPAPESKPPETSTSHGFHPRQTIISEPLHPTHPRQTLIQPAAPPEPPRILPQLPNIVRLAASEPARPKLQLTPEQLAAMRPKAVASRAAQDSAALEIPTPEKSAGEINIASSAQAPPKPALPVSPMSAPRTAPHRGDNNAVAPEFTQQSAADVTTLIALSATPTPVAPPSSIPSGNLSARISISPEGSQPGAPAGATQGNGTSASPTAGAAGHGPEGIFISGNNVAAAPASGLGMGSASRGAGNALAARPVPRASIPPRDSNAPRLNSGSAQESPKLDIPAEKVLGFKRVYTLHVNMPNLTSASGSWV
jgi:hypothetical protein